jgi:hypothetical protein
MIHRKTIDMKRDSISMQATKPRRMDITMSIPEQQALSGERDPGSPGVGRRCGNAGLAAVI